MEHIQKLMSVQDFAEQMTKNVPIGVNKIYSMVKEPGFPSIKIGGRYYVLVDKVNDWLDQQMNSKSEYIKIDGQDQSGGNGRE